MKEIVIKNTIESYKEEELCEDDRRLIDVAKKATDSSYAPYSNFRVGAAALLKNGTIVKGANQENAAYPSGLCAERTALFSAGANYPEEPVVALAIAARNAGGFIPSPIPPCGACRQVILETEARYHHPIRIILYGTEETYVINGISTLLPLSFEASSMEA